MSPSGYDLTGSEPVTTIQIDYAPTSPDPARVFRAMAKLIDAFQKVDRDLASSVSVSIEPILLLERVEAGSVRARLITALRQVHDDSLLNLDWKPLVGQYLVKGKHRLLKWLERNPEITSRSQVLELQGELLDIVPIPTPGNLQLPAPVPPAALLEDIKAIAEARDELQPGDSAVYEAGGDSSPVQAPVTLSSERIEQLLTQEIVITEHEMLLLVKKPDYLGQSRWEFRLDDHTIEAKLQDDAWLARFKAGHIVLRPGDALRAVVKSEAYRGFEGNVVATRYYIRQVLGVVHDQDTQQTDFTR